jgi:uncharacterized protein YndB with AHSA1/START domain
MTARVRLERTFHAPVARVFGALVDPAQLVRWWGPPGVETSVAEIDLRVGGRCRWVMHPGGRAAVLHGRIIELDPPRLLVMTHRWDGDEVETLVTIRLGPAGDGTRLELIHERLPEGIEPGEFAAWWERAFDSLSAHLERSTCMNTSRTRDLCRAYFDAWTHRRGPDALRPLLAEDFVFQAGPMRVEGREQFLRLAAWPDGATTTLIVDAYDGNHGLQLYQAVNGPVAVKIAEHLTVRDDTIVSTETITDPVGFSAFMAGGAR